MSKQSPKKREIEPLTIRSARAEKTSRPMIEPSNLWAYLIFAVVAVAFFSPFLFGKAFLWEDFLEQFFPHEVYAARSFSDGVIPFWNPFEFCGMPFMADLQNGFFYPGNQLMYLFSGGRLGIWLAQFFVVIHYLIAMIGMWKAARGLGIGGWGAILAGVGYGLGGMLVVHMIHPNMLFHMAWFPVVFHLFHGAVTRGSWLHTLLCGITLGVMLLSGHPQLALYIIFYLGCYALYVLVRDIRGGDDALKRSAIIRGVMAAVAVAVGAGIFAIQLLPAQELAGLSERVILTPEKMAEGSIGFGHLITLVVPKIFGVVTGDTPPDLQYWPQREMFHYWESVIYVGVVVLLLAAVGLASRRLGSLRWFLAGMALFGILFALGDSFFVHGIISRLPLFDRFRIPTRMALFFSFGAALLAGVGLERVIRRDEQEGRLLKVGLILGGIIVLIGLLTAGGVLASALGAPEELGASLSRTGIAPILIGGAALAIVWASLRGKMPGVGAAVALLSLAVIDLFIFGVDQNSATVSPEQIYASNDRDFEAMKAQPPDNLFRVKMREGGAALMKRNQGAYSGIMLFEGYNPLLLARRVPPAETPEKAYDLMNIRYAIRIDTAAQRLGMIERTTPYPHARMMYDAKTATPEGVLELLKGGTVDYGRTVLLEKEPGITLDGTGSGTAKITRYDAGAIDVDVETDKPGILLLSEVWYPAWKPYVDGKEAEMLIANSSLRAVAVPGGRHKVEIRYESDSFGTGKWITILTLVIAVAGSAFLLVRGRSAKTQAPAAA